MTDCPRNAPSGIGTAWADCEDLALGVLSTAFNDGWPRDHLAYLVTGDEPPRHIAAVMIDENLQAWVIDDPHFSEGAPWRPTPRRWDGMGKLVPFFPRLS